MMIAASSEPTLSIIIPTYNREETLCNTIRDLLAFSDQYLELIIVDQTLKHLPETSSYLSNLPYKIKIIKSSTPSLPRARNIGLKEAKGEIILYLDDDIKPLPTLIDAHIRHYGDPTIGGIAGPVIPAYGKPRRLDPRYYTSPMPWRYVRFDQDWDLCEVPAAPGGNMSLRRTLVFEAGGFDEQFVGNAYREETDFCLRLRKMSYRILFDPEAGIIHYAERDGGCENSRFDDLGRLSFRYYVDFVHNNIYFFFKHVPKLHLPELIWELYRNHVGNKHNLRQSLRLLSYRHAAFFIGLFKAYKTWKLFRFRASNDLEYV